MNVKQAKRLRGLYATYTKLELALAITILELHGKKIVEKTLKDLKE